MRVFPLLLSLLASYPELPVLPNMRWALRQSSFSPFFCRASDEECDEIIYFQVRERTEVVRIVKRAAAVAVVAMREKSPVT